MSESAGSHQRKRVVVVGGGFGGLETAKALKNVDVDLTLVDRTNHHLFQPLLYQVAMAGLSPADIAMPIRAVLRKQRNATVLLGEVRTVDVAEKKILLVDGAEVPYDFLVLSAGGQTSYFGHDEWEKLAPGLKSVDDAVEIRRRVLLAFEAAERENDPEIRKTLLTFVVIGGGPTGVELAGAICELSRTVLAQDFRRINPAESRVILVEAGKGILGSFPESLQQSAAKQLKGLGGEIRLGQAVSKVEPDAVWLGNDKIASSTVIWGAGVKGSPLGQSLGVPLDRAGRVIIEPDLSIPGHPEVFVIGDMAAFLHQNGSPLPGVSPVAMQQGRCVARNIAHSLNNKPRETFRYWDKGSMATIGRSRAIAWMGKLELSGFLAWMAWLVVHLYFLISYRNRLMVLLNWAYAYFTYGRGSRLITGVRGIPRLGRRSVPSTTSKAPPATSGEHHPQ